MCLKITRAGLLDTIQDNGRYGFQHLGINPGGVMDCFAAPLAHALLGKSMNSPVLELHFPAAQFLFQQSALICMTGADFTPCINGEEVPMNQPIAVGQNSVLSFQKNKGGARCYLAMLNDLHIEPWLNSYSTNLKAVAGGFMGRLLRRSDEIAFAKIDFHIEEKYVLLPWKYKAELANRNDIEVIAGPEWTWLTEKSRQAFLQHLFTITPASDRMGYRLQGGGLEQQQKDQLVSSGVTFGTVQLLPNGQLIVLMADHQTTGGYPRIANVIAAHLPRLAQKGAGEGLRFSLTTTEAAEEKWMTQQNFLTNLQNTCKLKLQNWLQQHA
ncbi:MAG TPA: biotin-dependent carboxyltransferase family protein [Flavisolibacter sp.]|nr:biotin-dependent carboxyltransferase family protein [Flavisolibacter sp.]